MTIMFRSGTFRQKLLAILSATRLHATNLALFALIYKTLTLLPRHLLYTKRPSSVALPKTLAHPHPFFSGLVAGYLVFGRTAASRSAVTQQIVIYVFARVVLGFAKLAVTEREGAVRRERRGFQAGYERGYSSPSPSPSSGQGHGKLKAAGWLLDLSASKSADQRDLYRRAILRAAWPLFASCSWGAVMWLFERYPEVLQLTLRSSMRFIYEDCEEFGGLWDLFVVNKV